MSGFTGADFVTAVTEPASRGPDPGARSGPGRVPGHPPGGGFAMAIGSALAGDTRARMAAPQTAAVRGAKKRAPPGSEALDSKLAAPDGFEPPNA